MPKEKQIKLSDHCIIGHSRRPELDDLNK